MSPKFFESNEVIGRLRTHDVSGSTPLPCTHASDAWYAYYQYIAASNVPCYTGRIFKGSWVSDEDGVRENILIVQTYACQKVHIAYARMGSTNSFTGGLCKAVYKKAPSLHMGGSRNFEKGGAQPPSASAEGAKPMRGVWGSSPRKFSNLECQICVFLASEAIDF